MNDEPLVLGIETSCDETGVGIVRGAARCSPTRSPPASRSTPGSAAWCPRWPAGRTSRRWCRRSSGPAARPGSRSPTSTRSPSPPGPGLAGALLVGVAAAKALRRRRSDAAVRREPPRRARRRRHRSSTARCPSPRSRCWSPAGTRRCCSCRRRRRRRRAARRDHRRRRRRGVRQGRPAARAAVPRRPARSTARRATATPVAIAFPRGLTAAQGPGAAPLRLLLLRPEDRGRPLGRGARAGRRAGAGGRRGRELPGGGLRRAHRARRCSPAGSTASTTSLIGGGVAANSRLRALAAGAVRRGRASGCGCPGRACAPTTARWSPRSARSWWPGAAPPRGSTSRPTPPCR